MSEKFKRRPLNAAQVGRILEILQDMFVLLAPDRPGYIRLALAYSLLHEIMYTANLHFEDEAARSIGTLAATRADGLLGEAPRD